ncbi:hypothetical protein BDZ97DRAFT_1192286 [Flammula alnicola]|nr:hypothetical protein BDZ97DRAFT_1192286 [Flammula alnicola]
MVATRRSLRRRTRRSASASRRSTRSRRSSTGSRTSLETRRDLGASSRMRIRRRSWLLLRIPLIGLRRMARVRALRTLRRSWLVRFFFLLFSLSSRRILNCPFLQRSKASSTPSPRNCTLEEARRVDLLPTMTMRSPGTTMSCNFLLTLST